MANAHITLKFAVNADSRISMSSWIDTSGRKVHAVALEIKRGGKWALDSNTCAEWHGANAEDNGYRATHYASQLVAGVLGECPFRFFKTNLIQPRRRNRAA